jgi:hypothetical protein
MSVVPFPAFRRSERHDPEPPRRPSADPAGANVVALWGSCPWSDDLSDYDRRNINLYARLLYDESEGATEDDLVREVMGLEPCRNRARTLGIYERI